MVQGPAGWVRGVDGGLQRGPGGSKSGDLKKKKKGLVPVAGQSFFLSSAPPHPPQNMSTRATTSGSRGRPPTGPLPSSRPTRATAAALASHPLRSTCSCSPASAGARTPSARSRDASPVRLPSPRPATVGETGPTALHEEVYPPPPAASEGAHVSSLAQYRAMHARSLADPEAFWGELAAEYHWETPWEAGNFTR